MNPKPIEPPREVLPPSIPYYVPAGGLIITAVVALVTWGIQNPEYPCSAINAMCAERERREVERAATATVALPVPAPRLSLQLPPVPQEGWRRAEEGCPPHYLAINGACWIGVEEPPPCPTSYRYRDKCYAPLPATPRRPGVSDGALR